MRFAVLFPALMYYDGHRYSTRAYYQYQLLELRKHLQRLDLITYVRHSTTERGTEPVDRAALSMLPLPYSQGGIRRYTVRLPIVLFALWRLFRRHAGEWDAVVLYEPDVLSVFARFLCYMYSVPAVLYLGGRADQAVLSVPRNQSAVRRPLARLLALWYRTVTPLLVARTATIVTGKDLYESFTNGRRSVYRIVASMTHLHDIVGTAELDARDWIPGKLHVLSVCRIVPVKGLEYLIEAIYQVRRSGVAITATIVGPVPELAYKQHLTKQIKERGLEDAIHLPGAVSHGEALQEYYKTADVFALPSLSEGTPKVIPEALAAGLPIVASAVGGIPELIDGDENAGILVEPKDSAALAGNLVRLAQDVDYRRHLADAAIVRAQTMTVETQMQSVFNIIHSTIDDHRKSLGRRKHKSGRL